MPSRPFATGRSPGLRTARVDGWRLNYAEVSRRGFPLKLGLRFEQPVAGSPDATWTWSASRALLSTPVFGSEFVRLAIKGDQTLEIASATGGERQRYGGRAGRFAFDIAPGGWMPNGRLSVRNLAIDGEAGGESLALHWLDLVSHGDPAAAADPTISSYAAELERSGCASGPSACLSRSVAKWSIWRSTLKLLGGLDAGPWPAAVAKWRDEGGAIEATRLALICGPLTLSGEGDLHPQFGRPADRRDDDANSGLRGGARPVGGERRYSRRTRRQPRRSCCARWRVGTATALPCWWRRCRSRDRTISVGPVPLLRLPALSLLQGAPKTH